MLQCFADAPPPAVPLDGSPFLFETHRGTVEQCPGSGAFFISCPPFSLALATIEDLQALHDAIARQCHAMHGEALWSEWVLTASSPDIMHPLRFELTHGTLLELQVLLEGALTFLTARRLALGA